jgi:hypothetical protein
VFIHGVELLSAIDRGQFSFNVEGSTDHVPVLGEGAAYSDVAQHAPHATKITYHLDPPAVARYVNLDAIGDRAQATIAELSDHHLVHCDWKSMGTEVNTYVVGSNQGHWSRLPQVAPTTDQGFLVRRVTSARVDDQRPACMHLSTETVHPWELFSAISIVAHGASPYQHTYQYNGHAPDYVPPVRPSSVDGHASQGQQLMACDASGYGSCALRINDSSPAFMFNTADGQVATMPNAHLGADVKYNETSGEVTMRYDTSLRGVICTNCFAFIGTGFEVRAALPYTLPLIYTHNHIASLNPFPPLLSHPSLTTLPHRPLPISPNVLPCPPLPSPPLPQANVQYTRATGRSAEVHLTGAAGFNIDLEFRNASLGGSYTFPVYSPLDDEHWVGVDIGTAVGLPEGTLTLGTHLTPLIPLVIPL